jgi:hypothetical protein
MYVAVRRYEGVTDPQKVGQLVEEGFVPIVSECRDSWLTTWWTPETA